MAPQFSIETKKIIMDTKLVREFGTEILSYRLRTVRQKKRMQYEDFDKQLIKIGKEENALWRQRRNLGWEPLLPPIQSGWKRFFVLRSAIRRHIRRVLSAGYPKGLLISVILWPNIDLKIKFRR